MLSPKNIWADKHQQVVLFSSTAIALYGYDQGMMSLINTNYDYLSTMGISETNPLVGVIVSVYYLGCAVGAVIASYYADRFGRKPSIFFCLATASLGNLITFVAGLGYQQGALWVMLGGRIIMGLGVGGIDSVVPIYSSELSEDGGRGRALAQEFQANILGLNMAFALNLVITIILGKHNQVYFHITAVSRNKSTIVKLTYDPVGLENSDYRNADLPSLSHGCHFTPARVTTILPVPGERR